MIQLQIRWNYFNWKLNPLLSLFLTVNCCLTCQYSLKLCLSFLHSPICHIVALIQRNDEATYKRFLYIYWPFLCLSFFFLQIIPLSAFPMLDMHSLCRISENKGDAEGLVFWYFGLIFCIAFGSDISLVCFFFHLILYIIKMFSLNWQLHWSNQLIKASYPYCLKHIHRVSLNKYGNVNLNRLAYLLPEWQFDWTTLRSTWIITSQRQPMLIMAKSNRTPELCGSMYKKNKNASSSKKTYTPHHSILWSLSQSPTLQASFVSHGPFMQQGLCLSGLCWT